MKNKAIISLLLILVMVCVGLAACGGGGGSDEQPADTPEETSSVVEVAGHTYTLDSVTRDGEDIGTGTEETIVFAEDGTCTMTTVVSSGESASAAGTYEQSAAAVKVTWSDGEGLTLDKEYKADGDKLINEEEVSAGKDADGNRIWVDQVVTYLLSE